MSAEPFDISRGAGKVRYSDAIGHNIVCEDGSTHRVVTICGSHRYPWKAIINEPDPDSSMGHFVSLLSLVAQLHGKPLPTVEQQAAFARAMSALSWSQEPKARFRMSKTGVIVPIN